MTGKLPRRRALLATLAVLAGAALPIVATALPAQAINCDYGDNFYQFHSDWSYNFSATVTDPGGKGQFLADVPSGGTLFCQTASFNDTGGVGWSEWVQKNTANCLTFDLADGYAVKLQTCAQLDSQYWSLQQNISGEDWGRVE